MKCITVILISILLTSCGSMKMYRSEENYRGARLKLFSMCLGGKYYLSILPFRVGTYMDSEYTPKGCSREQAAEKERRTDDKGKPRGQ